MNKKEYKRIMSQIYPSDQAVERIMDMTNNKKSNKALIVKRLATATLALAIVIGGSFGVNQIANKNAQKIDKPNIVQGDTNPLSIMVAYAGEYVPVSEIKAGSMNKQEVFYSIHYADINDKEEMSKAKQLFDKDAITVSKNAEALGSEGYTASAGSGSGSCSSKDGEETAMLYTVRGGSFALNLDDYSTVKTFTVENSGKYGVLVFDCEKTWNELENDVDNNGTGLGILEGNKFSFTGEELKESQDSKTYEGGTKHIVNKGYRLNWEPSDELYNTIGNDLNFDLANIKDTITFTVEYNDGTTQTASLNLYFDTDGYMHFE